MVKLPWTSGKLRRGQIIQRLESLHCSKVTEHFPGSEMWRAPTGQHFSISYDDCDAKQLQAIVDRIEKWVEEADKRKD
jgi:hypothetical protein